jgi:hypothetical protein
MMTSSLSLCLGMEPFVALNRQTWGIIGVGAVLVLVIVAIIFYMLGTRSERH